MNNYKIKPKPRFILEYKWDCSTVNYNIDIKDEFIRFKNNVNAFIDEINSFNPRWEMVEAASNILMDGEADLSTILEESKLRKTNRSKLFLYHIKIFDSSDIDELIQKKELSIDILIYIHRKIYSTLIVSKNTKIGIIKDEKSMSYLVDLFSYINSNKDDENIIIKLAIVFYQLMTIRPFYSKNYYVASILIKVVLAVKRGIQLYPSFNISNIFIRHKQEYDIKIKSISNNNLNQWIRFYLEIVKESMNLFDKQVKVIIDYKKECIKKYGERETKMFIDFLFINSSIIEKELSCSRRQAQRNINSLIDNSEFVNDHKTRYKVVVLEKMVDYLYISQLELDDALNSNVPINYQIEPYTFIGEKILEKHDNCWIIKNINKETED